MVVGEDEDGEPLMNRSGCIMMEGPLVLSFANSCSGFFSTNLMLKISPVRRRSSAPSGFCFGFQYPLHAKTNWPLNLKVRGCAYFLSAFRYPLPVMSCILLLASG